MRNRRDFLKSALVVPVAAAVAMNSEAEPIPLKGAPVIVSTWDSGLRANAAGWPVLARGGSAMDAVEAAAMSAEDETSCCVGLEAFPDRDGFVTLDASIMDDKGRCGSVAFMQGIKHPISVARRLMETTKHVFLAGDGAQQFAVANGFEKQPLRLSPDADKAWKEWLRKSDYTPVINIENRKVSDNLKTSPATFPDGSVNHDTMGTVALDAMGRLSGACTTSGMAFKMHGRVGDSPIIGAGLFVDNEIGAATSSGVGEEVIKICGTHLVVELMRFGRSPVAACREAVERIVKRDPTAARELQVGFLAISKAGQVGAFSIQPGFTYSVTSSRSSKVLTAKSHFPKA
jgi:N4-(beta-N-acetylglucosaminyl)-L-asparaginase